jgi:hypothetical protein
VENIPFDATSQTLTRSYDFLDLPPLAIENTPPFFRREPAFHWWVQSQQPRGPFGPSELSFDRGLVVHEMARGETEPRITTTADRQNFRLPGLAEGEAAIFHSFTSSFLRDAARRSRDSLTSRTASAPTSSSERSGSAGISPAATP